MNFKKYLIENKLSDKKILDTIEKSLKLFKKILKDKKCVYRISNDRHNIYGQPMCEIIIDKIDNKEIKHFGFDERIEKERDFYDITLTDYITIESRSGFLSIVIRIYNKDTTISNDELLNFVKSIIG